jgi:hypothetical protein
MYNNLRDGVLWEWQVIGGMNVKGLTGGINIGGCGHVAQHQAFGHVLADSVEVV